MSDPYTPTTEEVRFYSRIAQGECWEWLGSLDPNGYGRFYVDGKAVRAHRWSYELLVGPIPEGLVIDHLCRNRACVNPDHLEPVTNRENLLRGAGPASRTACPRGHAYAPERNSRGERRCMTCHREGEAARRATGKTAWTCDCCGITVQNRSRHSKTHIAEGRA